jgi:three-Cys-motif partner protein
MMANQSFGGPWTERKLKCLRDYLNAYRTIFTGNPKARYFRTWYVDAFAGTGSRATAATDNTPAPLLDIYEDKDANTEAQEYQDGSAKIALGLPSPFDNYLFIEKSRKRVGELQSVIRSDFSQLFDRCQFRTGDANAEIKEWCAARDWSKERAVVFLDPYGMQVEWSTVETLAATKGVDLWYLFPGIARLLRRDGNIDEKWKARLDILLGTDGWRMRFFQPYRARICLVRRKALNARRRRKQYRALFLSGWQHASGRRWRRASFCETRNRARSIFSASPRRTNAVPDRH